MTEQTPIKPRPKTDRLEAEKPFETDIDGLRVIVSPPAWKTRKFTELLNKPARIETSITHTCFKSFIDYVNRFKDPERSIIRMFATAGGAFSAAAVLDYHKPRKQKTDSSRADSEAPGWLGHVARFNPSITAGWNSWDKTNGKYLEQAMFADFIYQHMADIKAPDGAELLAIVKTLKATAKGEFKDRRDLHTGSIELIYQMQVSAAAGTSSQPIKLPESCRVNLQTYYGGPVINLQADIIMQIPARDGDKLRLGFRFYRLADQLDELAGFIAEEMGDKTGLPVFQCDERDDLHP